MDSCAFDPRTDDVELLRTVLLLLRTIAQAAVSRHGVAELATADEKLAEALGELLRIDKVCKSAGLIRKNADTIERECDSLQLCVRRLVVQAREALATADGGPVAGGRGDRAGEPVGKSMYRAAPCGLSYVQRPPWGRHEPLGGTA